MMNVLFVNVKNRFSNLSDIFLTFFLLLSIGSDIFLTQVTNISLFGGQL